MTWTRDYTRDGPFTNSSNRVIVRATHDRSATVLTSNDCARRRAHTCHSMRATCAQIDGQNSSPLRLSARCAPRALPAHPPCTMLGAPGRRRGLGSHGSLEREKTTRHAAGGTANDWPGPGAICTSEPGIWRVLGAGRRPESGGSGVAPEVCYRQRSTL